MKKIITRFVVLGCLCLSLGLLSLPGLAGTTAAKPGKCRPVCISEGVECFQKWDFVDQVCVISLCYNNSQNCPAFPNYPEIQ